MLFFPFPLVGFSPSLLLVSSSSAGVLLSRIEVSSPKWDECLMMLARFMGSFSDSMWKAPLSLSMFSSGVVPEGVCMFDTSTPSPVNGDGEGAEQKT